MNILSRNKQLYPMITALEIASELEENDPEWHFKVNEVGPLAYIKIFNETKQFVGYWNDGQ